MGNDDVLSPAVPPPDYLYNTWMRDVLGNKLDVASIAATASAQALLRYIQESLDAFVLSPYDKVVDFPEFASEDSVVVLAIGLYDKATWQEIPVADIVAGTVDIINLSGGVETPITAGAALTKKDGLLYIEIDTDNANWANGDSVKVEPATLSTVDIGGDLFNVTFAPQICHLSDYGLLGDNISAILTAVDEILLDTANLDKGHIEGDGFSSVYAIIDEDITFQISIGDLIGDFPAIGEITSPGTCTITRIRAGAGSAVIVASQACTAGNNGEVGYTYGWPNASWLKGDVAEITFSGIVVTKNAKTFNLPDYEVFVPIGLPGMLAGWDALVQAVSDIDTLLQVVDGKIDILDQVADDILTLLTTVDGKVDVIDGNVDLLVDKPQCIDFWCPQMTTITGDAAGADVVLPSVTLPALVMGTFRRVEILFSFRKLEDSSAAQNYINTGDIQVRKDTPGTWEDGYQFPANALEIQSNENEGQGMEIVGNIDVSGEVDVMNDIYEFRFQNLDVNGNNLHFHDVRTGLRIWV